MNLKTGRIRFLLTTTHLLMYVSRLQYISFHEQSDRVSFLEGKVFQYGWIFLPFSFFYRKLEGLCNIHLNENSKWPWDHPRWHTYQNLQTSLPHVCSCFTPTLLYKTNKVADQPGYRTFLSAPLLWIQTLNILSGLVWVKPVCYKYQPQTWRSNPPLSCHVLF